MYSLPDLGWNSFNDCKHESEPNCAVTKALSDGIINEKRLVIFLLEWNFFPR
jgi:hypothetical protein